ncbi:sentrin-specific protease 1 [Augochlora pura]
MLIFDFLKKFFGWVDETPRKRRAVSFSIENEFVMPKKQCCDYETNNVDEDLTEINDDSDSDDVHIIARHKHSPNKSSSRLNGTCSSKDKSYRCCPSPFSLPKSQDCYNELNMGYFGNKIKDEQNIETRQRCSTLNKTYQLKEKNQYEELLQNFLPHRIHVICDKYQEKQSTPDVVEIIDLEKSDSLNSLSKVHQIPRKKNTLQMHWSTPHKETRNKDVIITGIKDNETSIAHSICKKTQYPRKQVNTEKLAFNKNVESPTTNTLRDELAAKAVIREDFIPEVAKRYNERIEQRCKEAEELKKMTCVLSKHNRLAREAALEEHLARSMRLCKEVLDERGEHEEPLLPALTEEMMQDVKNALIPRPPDEVLVEGFGLRITRKDIHTLADLNWLNDEVINFYMNLLIARSTNNDRYPKAHAMNTFFYPKLISGGHASLKRWTRKIDIFAQDLIVIPIHLDIHWCMSIIDFRDKSIRYYDSMGSNNMKCLSALRQYLEDESLDKKKQQYDTSNWKLECPKNIPQQMNGSDCGVFSCMFAEYICVNKKITFTQQDMPYFRNKMVYEILKSTLL